MLLRDINDAHLTYCTNVHPGESLTAVRDALQHHVQAVKRSLCPSEPFGVGLRLAAEAARALANPEELARFRDELAGAGLYCFTLNGFPYGAFHATRVKERVYLPDWLEPERVRYTQELARILSQLLPPGVRGSISTVPGCFRPKAATVEAAPRMARALLEVVAVLVDLARVRGTHVALALEPEPHCFLETTPEAVRFFEEQLLTAESRARLCQLADIEPTEAERALRSHLGVCLDTCHASVEFESPLGAYRKLRAAGIAVPKIQLSAGLRLPRATPESLGALAAFGNEVYLHQTVVQSETGLQRFLDLPEALGTPGLEGKEWRVHFHVPIFMRELAAFESTQPDLCPLLAELSRDPDCPQLEVETYTWDVLPPAFRNVPIDEAIARELRFVLSELRSGATTTSRT